MGESVGERFVTAIAARDVDGLRAVLAQQMYYRERDGRLVHARVVCSGYRRRG